MGNGVLWNSVFLGDEDNIRHILYGSWLIRDWDYANTSLTGLQIFDSDGNLTSTLFSPSNPGGAWNDFGYLSKAGPKFNQKMEVKPTEVMQSRWAARFDYTGQSEEISATLMESNPVVDAVRSNQLLSNLQQVGTVGYSSAAPVDLDLRWRQCIFIGIDGRSGLNYYVIRVYPKVLITDFGDSEWNVENTDQLPIKAMAIPDEFTTPPDGVTVGSPRWILRDGPAWRQQGQSVFELAVPVATAETGLKATLAFPTPAGMVAPITYTAAQQLTAGGAFTNSTLVGSPAVSGNTTTITVGSLTASTQYNAFKVTATDSSGTPVVIVSQPSTSITSTAS